MPHLPPTLRPLLDFLNTVDVEEGTDVFAAGPIGLNSWLEQQNLCRGRPEATHLDVQAALDLRRGLRSLALANTGTPADSGDVAAAQSVLKAFPFRLDLPRGTDTNELEPALTPSGGAVPAALGLIAAGYFASAVRGDWARIRRCPAHDCAWVFWDSSKNGSRRWCSMRVCGSRAKARAYAERHRT